MPLSLKDTVYRAILTDILNDTYKPNDILNERTLVEKYQCSKSPVREALLSLCDNNILRSIPRCGYEVIRITQEDVESLLHIRYLLEGGILRFSLDRFAEENLAVLEQLEVDFIKCNQDIWEYWDLNSRFHLELMKPSGNQYAYDTLKRILEKLKLAYAQLSRNKWTMRKVPDEAKNHDAILSALRKQDASAVLSALKTDIMYFSDTCYYIPDYFQ